MAISAQVRLGTTQAAEVQTELNRILASGPFANSPRMSRFLRVIVEAALAGDAGALKEYAIGCSVFDRDASFDPRLDPVVRNEARRLRQKLSLYYESAHSPARVRITLPKGGYAPAFEQLEHPASAVRETVLPDSGLTDGLRKVHRRLAALFVAALLLCSSLLFLFPALRRHASATHKPNPEALAAWQKGRHYVEQIGQPIEAMAELRKAIHLDPQFADAYATLAAAYGMAALQKKVSMHDGTRQAKELAERALRLDPNSAEGYLMLGAAEVFNRDWSRAEDLMRYSLKLRPNDAFALMTTADIALQPQRKLDEAADLLERATRIEPGNIVYWQTLITVRCEAHEFPLALEDTQRAIDHHPSSELFKGYLAFIYLWTGEVTRATQIADRVRMDDGSREYWNLELALAQNRRRDARQIAQRFLARPGLDDADRAVLFAVLGNEEQVLANLNREEDNRSLKGVLYARLDDHFNSLRSHPAFQQLLRRMRLDR
jgi:tetratricopeptide (TPR) repeat protein